jgi:hypothetical protein
MKNFLQSFGVSSGVAMGLIVAGIIGLMLCLGLLCFVCVVPSGIYDALATPIP